MASGTDEMTMKIEKLTCDNYHNWKFQMKMYLIGKDLWDIVQGTEELKENPTADESTKFRKREQLALSLVCLSVSTSLHVYVRSVKTSKEAWDVLAKHFEDKTLSKKIFYRRKLYSARMEKGTSMVDHINYVKTLSEHLQAVDDEVDDKDLVIILLSSLPVEYNHLVTALETIAADKLTWEYVRDRAMNEYERKYGAGTTIDTPDALFSNSNFRNFKRNNRGNRGGAAGRGGGRGGGGRGGTSQNFRCHNCNEKGHYARNCPQKDKKQAEDANMSKVRETFETELALKAGDDADSSQDWWIDSGASQHMTPNKEELLNYQKFSKLVEINLADNSALYAYGCGDVQLHVHDDNGEHDILLSKVLFVPKMKKKLLSIPAVIRKGVQVTFVNNNCVFTANDKSYTVGHIHGKLYKLNTFPTETCCHVSSDNSDTLLWHLRYGHLGYNNLLTLSNDEMVSGMKLNSKAPDNPCEGCLMGKQNRLPFPKKSLSKSTHPLDIIHSDICGPMKVNSVGGSRYFITFIDDFTRYYTVYMLKHKDEALQKFKEFSEMVENMFGHRIKKIRSDNGGEYINNEFDLHLKECGIMRDTTIPYSPQQNGVAERANRTLMETVRCMLHYAGLPIKFWAEALATAVYLKNRSPTSCFGGVTPYECWWKRKPEVGNLKVFGCVAYAHIPSEKRSKLDKKSLKCIFIGYAEQSKGYKLFDPVKQKMFRSRDVVFDEKQFQKKFDTGDQPDQLLPDAWFQEPQVTFENQDEISDNIEIEALHEERGDNAENEALNEEVVGDGVEHPRPRRMPDRYGDWEYASIAVHDEPNKLAEALDGKHAKQWKDAIKSELDSLKENNTWSLVDLPEGKNVVGSKWVFKIKCDVDGKVDRFKARLVAQGFTQEYGVDYNETFAPVARQSSIRCILAIANQLDLEIHQMDVKSAFLNGSLEEEIYMRQPEGFSDPIYPDKVWKLNKSLYGLKQSARCWNDVIDHYLKENGYTQSEADRCIYQRVTNKNGQKCLMLIGVYVDDTIIASNDAKMLKAEKAKLAKRFKMEDQGDIHFLLGMCIRRNRKSRELSIDQTVYLKNVLQKFGMQDCRPVATPMETGKSYHALDDDEEIVDVTLYQSAIGSLIYASICTRPDISAAVGALSRHMSKPGPEHWVGVKRVFRYIRGTLSHGLKFTSSDNFSLYGYSDADWGGDVATRKSTSGYVFRLGGATISWKSKKQSVIALSSTESEYIALCSATQETVWLRVLLKSLNLPQQKPTTVYEDNQGTICLSKNPKDHSRTKHIDIKFHYTREAIRRNEVDVSYCPTNQMLADIFTKGLPKPKHELLRKSLGVDESIR